MAMWDTHCVCVCVWEGERERAHKQYIQSNCLPFIGSRHWEKVRCRQKSTYLRTYIWNKHHIIETFQTTVKHIQSNLDGTLVPASFFLYLLWSNASLKSVCRWSYAERVKSPLQPSIEINSPECRCDDTRIDSKLDNVSIYTQIGIDSGCLCT